MIPVLIGLGVLAVAGSTAYFWDDIFGSDEAKNKINGKKIAVLGTNQVGKTTLYEFFKTQKISEDKTYTPTRSLVQIEECIISIGNSELKLSVNHDMGGGQNSYADWKEQVNNADYIFYLINANSIIGNKNDSNDLKDRKRKSIGLIRRDLKHIGEEIRNQTKSKVFIIVNIFNYNKEAKTEKGITLYDGLYDKYKKNESEFEDNLRNQPILQEAIISLGGENKCNIIIGSLASTSEAKELVKNIINRI